MSELGWYWHIHHELICEPATEPIEARIAYIKTNKPEHEVETRLRLIAPVTVGLPAPYVEAWTALDKAAAAYVEARTAFDKARAAFDKTGAAYDKARAAYVTARLAARDELEALHRIDCPAAIAGACPWNGKTIFPKAAA